MIGENPLPVLDHFHLIAPFYDRIFSGLRTDRLRALLGLPMSGWLLDVGGGTGRVARTLHGAGQVVILDVSVGMLRQARNKGLLVSPARPRNSNFASRRATRIKPTNSICSSSRTARLR